MLKEWKKKIWEGFGLMGKSKIVLVNDLKIDLMSISRHKIYGPNVSGHCHTLK